MAESRHDVKALWAAQARRLPLWFPVLIGIGVWLRLEAWTAPVAVGASLAVAGGAVAWLMGQRALAFGVLAVLLGIGASELRLRAVASPVLESEFRGDVRGRIVALDRSQSGAARVLLDTVTLTGLHPLATPARVRIALLGRSGARPQIGSTIAVRAVLSPPPGPAAPGAFDFSRRAWFARIGAVGYARGSVVVLAAPDGAALARFRMRIADALRAEIGGAEGGIAAALTVGDRSGITDTTRDALRDSGLAHLLAISGLHLGLLGGLVYAGLRLLLALPPWLSEAFPTRKAAAIGGVVSVGIYLALAGASIATQRAFIMAAVVFGAVLLDRPAVTLRGLALAAALILLLRPESLFDAGFQMSFAAVTALVAAYERTRAFWSRRVGLGGVGSRLATFLLAAAMTSIVAGAATAPFAAYHFNRAVLWGLPANLVATPLMGVWIMPAIVLAAVLAPFGAAGPALSLLDAGLRLIVGVAETVSSLPGAVKAVAATAPWVLALTVLAGLWLCLWRERLRLLGIPGLLVALLFWSQGPRPEVLIAREARLIGVRGADGRLWLSRERAEPYSAELWLRRDGDVVTDQTGAFERRDWRCDRERCTGRTGSGATVTLLRIPGAASPCESSPHGAPAVVIVPSDDAPCMVFGPRRLNGVSSIAVHRRAGGGAAAERARRWRPPPLWPQ